MDNDKFPSPQPSAEATERCDKPAASFIPRWGMYFACVLPKGHEGDHQRGGNCFAHGEYVGAECPQWPECSKIMLERQVAAIPAPSGETRGTCDDCDIPHTARAGCIDWKPLAPEATTKEPTQVSTEEVNSFQHSADCPTDDSAPHISGVRSRAEIDAEFESMATDPNYAAAPGEAVGRGAGDVLGRDTTGFAELEKGVAICIENDSEWIQCSTSVVHQLFFELSTLRRERDQLLARLGLSGRAE